VSLWTLPRQRFAARVNRLNMCKRWERLVQPRRDFVVNCRRGLCS
jgi:hypothetical protein